MKRTVQSIILITAILVMMTGCAQVIRDAIGAASKMEVGGIKTTIGTVKATAEVAKATADKAEAKNSEQDQIIVKVAEAAKKVAETNVKTAQAVQAVARRADSLDTKLTTLTTRVDGVANQVADVNSTATGVRTELGSFRAAYAGDKAKLEAGLGNKADSAAIDDVKKQVASVDKKVQHVAGTVSNLGTKIGILKHAGTGVSNDSLLVWGFPVARYDDDKSDFKACAELLPGLKAALDQVVAAANDGKIKLKKVVGFASRQPFKKDGKVRDDSDELNQKCGTLRAQKVAEYLDKVTKDTVDKIDKSHGFARITDDFGGDTAKNRGVVIEIEALKSTI